MKVSRCDSGLTRHDNGPISSELVNNISAFLGSWNTTLCMLSVRDKKRRPFPVANTPRIDTRIQTTSSGCSPLSGGPDEETRDGRGTNYPALGTSCILGYFKTRPAASSTCSLPLRESRVPTFQFYSKRNDKGSHSGHSTRIVRFKLFDLI